MTPDKSETVDVKKSFFARKWKRYTVYALMGFAAWHYVYYTIEFNEKVRKPEERRDMMYIHWIKKQFPALRQYGIPYKDDTKSSE
ncbi:unnamed protein product [Thelazia callipaeda]|uniref:Uncharacterized protein n=1 Tax=Thelazia callipaeda TaxID=103827 RepID=A0A0N5D4T0_THECL|nr:unnamed protein product [Thelazia callipaeda]